MGIGNRVVSCGGGGASPHVADWLTSALVPPLRLIRLLIYKSQLQTSITKSQRRFCNSHFLIYKLSTMFPFRDWQPLLACPKSSWTFLEGWGLRSVTPRKVIRLKIFLF